jgi:succinate dehydrogenase flavin-adding protein (antitoxin of CptAB toxin-antitoxin module)
MDDKEVIWKCRRGTKELDILMSSFYYKHYKTASDSQKDAFYKIIIARRSCIIRFIIEQNIFKRHCSK